VEEKAPHILIPELDGGEWSVSGSGSFAPDQTSTGTYFMQGWLSPEQIWRKGKHLHVARIEAWPSRQYVVTLQASPFWFMNNVGTALYIYRAIYSF
jgi:hypothetical protein